MESGDEISEIWRDDLLDRRKVADYLTTYLLDRYIRLPEEKGFVLALSAEWGFGKTFLIDKWAKSLAQRGYPVVSFDAWANDFTPEPLVAFVSQVDKSLRPIVSKVPAAVKLLDSAINKAKVLWKPTAKVLLQIVAKKMANFTLEEIRDLFDAQYGDDVDADKAHGGKDADKVVEMRKVAEALKQVYDSSLKQHSDKQTAIASFRINLGLLVKQIGAATEISLPLFIFVDELDRCRPDYAIELLEGIKHLFGVPGVYFVVSLNLEQLGESTKSIYGASFAGHRYLKRFFDIEFKLPEPDDRLFAKSLFQHSALQDNSIFFSGFNQHNSISDETPVEISDIFSIYAQFFGIGPRDQQQVMRTLEAVCVRGRKYHVHWLLFLAILSHVNQSAFNKITKTMGAMDYSAFRQLVEPARREEIHFRTYNFGSDDGEVRRTPITEVAWIYYQIAWKNLTDVSAGGNSPHDFPGNIVNMLEAERPRAVQRGRHYPSSVAGYPDLISYAGHFVA
jgi:hypothetical protein